MKTLSATLLLVLLAQPAAGSEEHKPLHLEIGDPDRKGREVDVVLDAIVDTESGDLLTPAELAGRLADVRLLFVGESHTDVDFHRAQLRILEELRHAGRQVLIGLEMYPTTEQRHLDAWIAGHYSEDGFLELSKWYGSWNYHWNYYRDIFLFARDQRLPMFAVNSPREVIKAVREKGFDGLSDEEKAHMPPNVDVTSGEHRELFLSYFDDESMHSQMSDEQWDGMLRAQATWDATMAYNSVRALEEHGGERAILVVLIGSGHVAYGLGIERQAAQWFDGRMASVIPVQVRDEEGEPIASVRASYADFIWGLPPAADPLYPTLGFASKEIDGEDFRKIIYVAEDSLAEEAGFEFGDVLLSFDGVPLDREGVFPRLMAGKRWGDEATITVRRGEETVEIRCALRRRLPDDEDEDEEDGDGGEEEDDA